MNLGHADLVVGDVLMAPFVAYAALAGLVTAALRPLLRSIGFGRGFTNPDLTLFGIYVIVLAALIALL